MPLISEVLATAIQLHNAGRLQPAEEIYRRILSTEPDHVDALHLLGMIAYQRGNHDDAGPYISRAIELNPNQSAFHLNLGNVFSAMGKLEPAVNSYARSLQLEPDNAQAHCSLGCVLQAQGRVEQAISCFQRSLGFQPGVAVTHFNLGTALELLGRREESITSYRRALEIDPSLVEARNNLGNVLQDLNRFDEAIDCFQAAIKARPDRALVHYNFGVLYKRQRKLTEAANCFHRALELDPGHVAAKSNLGTVLYDQGNVSEAIAYYHGALDLNPALADVLNNLGIALHAQGRLSESVRSYRRALELQPNSAEVHSNLGTVFSDQGELDDAIACFLKAVELKPDDQVAHNNLGNALQAQGKLEEAIASFRRALALNPKYPAAYHNLGFACAKLKRFSDALSFHSQALALRPDYAEAHFGRASLNLLLGDFKNGWPEYEWRWKVHQLKERQFAQPLWDGSPLGKRAILLHAEQGFGDTFQFIRYAALIRKQNPTATIIAECQKPLVKVLARCPSFDRLVAEGNELPTFDVHSPLLSLAGVYSTTRATIPSGTPYLFADQSLVEKWRQRLACVRGFRIGINWQGRSGRGDFRNRDIPEEYFAALTEISGISLVSLQKGGASGVLISGNDPGMIFDPGPDFDTVEGAFMDTAALMMNLDLAISSDTSVSHLAGALGVPTWVALPFVPDWRWLLDVGDSPWYPTMRLFRQTARGDWSSVFDEIRTALNQIVPKAS